MIALLSFITKIDQFDTIDIVIHEKYENINFFNSKLSFKISITGQYNLLLSLLKISQHRIIQVHSTEEFIADLKKVY